MGGIGLSGSVSARTETATECVECRCTIAPPVGRSEYIDRCRNASLVGLSPETALPLLSTLDSVAGSSRPRQEFVGVIRKPPSTRTLMLPELPAVKPRSKIDLPNQQISSRSLDSVMAACFKARRGAPW